MRRQEPKLKALTLWQPWASLVAIGVKTIETRSWRAPANLIGERIAIHAAAKRPQRGLTLGEWQVYEFPKSSPGEFFAINEQVHERPLPLGAIVGSAVLEACIPMFDGEAEYCAAVSCLGVRDQDLTRFDLTWNGKVNDHGERGYDLVCTDVTAQRPYGDFAPGRWAWLLTDIKPTSDRCPWSGVSGRVPDPASAGLFGQLQGWMPCSVCNGEGVCEPIPAKGAQRIWNWEPGAN